VETKKEQIGLLLAVLLQFSAPMISGCHVSMLPLLGAPAPGSSSHDVKRVGLQADASQQCSDAQSVDGTPRFLKLRRMI